MAYSQSQWDKAKFLFELGNSLSDIYKETNIDSSTISKKAKKDAWVKGKNQELKTDIIDFEKDKSILDAKKSIAIEKVSQLEDYEITLFDEIIKKELRHESLIFSTASLALIRNNQLLTKNSKTVMLKVAQYGEGGQKIAEDYEPYEVELNPDDISKCVDSTDKASITLGVNQRHAPKSDVNVQQNNDNTTTEITVTKIES